MKTTRLLSAVGVAALLVACGGGGGDDAVSAASGAGTSDAGTSDAYVGTWKSGCFDSVLVKETAPAAPLKQTMTYVFTKVSDTKVSYVRVDEIYSAAGCTGSPQLTYTNRAPTNAVVIDGTGTVGAAAINKVTLVRGALGGGFSARDTITINGVVYPGDFFTHSLTYKSITRLAGGVLNFGDDTPVDAQGYPTTLDTELTFTKQ